MSVYVVPVVALCIPMVIVPIALGLRHARNLREMAHAERMRALELGVDLTPAVGLNWPSAAVCIALGAGVPIATFVLATLEVVATGGDKQVFGIALLVSVAAIWSAKSLANRMLAANPAVPSDAPPAAPSGKPTHYDPDAFDVVGSRG